VCLVWLRHLCLQMEELLPGFKLILCPAVRFFVEFKYIPLLSTGLYIHVPDDRCQ